MNKLHGAIGVLAGWIVLGLVGFFFWDDLVALIGANLTIFLFVFAGWVLIMQGVRALLTRSQK